MNAALGSSPTVYDGGWYFVNGDFSKASDTYVRAWISHYEKELQRAKAVARSRNLLVQLELELWN